MRSNSLLDGLTSDVKRVGMKANSLLILLMATYFVGTLAGMLTYFVLSDMPFGTFIYFVSLFGVPAFFYWLYWTYG